MNIHHLYPRNGVDGFGTNHKLNKRLLPENIHVNHHRIFGNLEFHHQILSILNLNSPILQRHIVQDIQSIVGDDPKYIYKGGIFIPKH